MIMLPADEPGLADLNSFGPFTLATLAMPPCMPSRGLTCLRQALALFPGAPAADRRGPLYVV